MNRIYERKLRIGDLTEGKDFIYFGEGYNSEIGDYKLYQPLTHAASMVLANGANWAISRPGSSASAYWDTYERKGYVFLFVTTEDDEYAIISYPSYRSFRVEVYSSEDKNLGYPDWVRNDSTIEEALSNLKKRKSLEILKYF